MVARRRGQTAPASPRPGSVDRAEVPPRTRRRGAGAAVRPPAAAVPGDSPSTDLQSHRIRSGGSHPRMPGVTVEVELDFGTVATASAPARQLVAVTWLAQLRRLRGNRMTLSLRRAGPGLGLRLGSDPVAGTFLVKAGCPAAAGGRPAGPRGPGGRAYSLHLWNARWPQCSAYRNAVFSHSFFHFPES